MSKFLKNPVQIELNAQSQSGDRKEIVRLLTIATEPEFTFKFTGDCK